MTLASSNHIAVIDYGMGNLHSVTKALEHAAPQTRVTLTSDPTLIGEADRVVFPGQGAMPDCMRELDARGLRDSVLSAARSKPFLGICIGLQLLFEHSEEGDTAGLGILPGQVRRFATQGLTDEHGARLKVPHMGWNQVQQTRDHPLWHGIAQQARFYYVHSYYVEPADPDLTVGTTCYPEPFTGAVARGQLFAVQFHPEKSHIDGLQLLANFAQWNGIA